MAHVVENDDVTPVSRSSRRKFGEAEDIALLKEVLANEAHMCRRGTMTDKFDEVACALNNSEALPWSTNGKHCNDRFKLLLAGFRRTDRARASASGTEEDFGEKDQLLADILSAVNDNEERGRVEREESAKRDERLVNAGQEVRANAMRRRAREESVVVSGDGDEEGDNAVCVTDSQENSETPTYTENQRARKRQKHSAFGK
jgi:hypothetical protein